MKKRKLVLLMTAAVLMSISFLGACTGNAKDPDQPPLASNSVIVADDSIPEAISPNITGVITGVSEVREGISILVEIPDTKNKYSDNRFYVTVNEKTVVENADKKRFDSFRELHPGDTVSVWFTGASSGTNPEYAVAQGVRVTSKVEDMLLTVRQGEYTIMASPTAGEVTSSDIKPLLYGSYLITDGNGTLTFGFAKQPVRVTASAVAAQSGETLYLTGQALDELELPGTLKNGDYTVTVKVESEDSADYYMFILSVR